MMMTLGLSTWLDKKETEIINLEEKKISARSWAKLVGYWTLGTLLDLAMVYGFIVIGMMIVGIFIKKPKKKEVK